MLGFTGKDDDKLSAYTLAEMLIVLLIISIILISLPLATKKLFAVKETKSYHGRYECFWDDATGKLKYYSVIQRPGKPTQVQEGELTGNKCEFTPPLTYPYLMVHAVGGGGSGGNLTTAAAAPEMVMSYYEYLPGELEEKLWSDWFRSFMDNVRSSSSNKTKYKIENGSSAKKSYPTNLIVRQINLKYRKSGNAGQVSSMFFPFIPAGNKFYLYPGKGGTIQAQNVDGESGGNSIVQVVQNGSTCDINTLDAPCNIIVARGGAGSVVLDSNNQVIDLALDIQLHGGKHSDYGISDYSDVKETDSGFRQVIDSANSIESSKIPANAGNGGNGANQYAQGSTAGFFYHEFNNFYGATGLAKLYGVNWVGISDLVNPSVYGSGCEVKTSGIESAYGGQLWAKRSIYNTSTTCQPSALPSHQWSQVSQSGSSGMSIAQSQVYQSCSIPVTYDTGYPTCGQNQVEYSCVVGDFYRSNYPMDCYLRVGPCAVYKFNNTRSLISSNIELGEYRNPQIYFDPNDYMKAYLEVEERIPSNSKYISCPAISGDEYQASLLQTTPCASKSMNFSGGICNASKGGSGAIVILW